MPYVQKLLYCYCKCRYIKFNFLCTCWFSPLNIVSLKVENFLFLSQHPQGPPQCLKYSKYLIIVERSIKNKALDSLTNYSLRCTLSQSSGAGIFYYRRRANRNYNKGLSLLFGQLYAFPDFLNSIITWNKLLLMQNESRYYLSSSKRKLQSLQNHWVLAL